jgi:hypothetical protein
LKRIDAKPRSAVSDHMNHFKLLDVNSLSAAFLAPMAVPTLAEVI